MCAYIQGDILAQITFQLCEITGITFQLCETTGISFQLRV